ncbi:MAG: hypothetical protein DMG32_26715 [Acidobacteria bacterium]|nr:MAG: hypothetical protein DMG32_26715 [Acidobacteriota bacterium]
MNGWRLYNSTRPPRAQQGMFVLGLLFLQLLRGHNFHSANPSAGIVDRISAAGIGLVTGLLLFVQKLIIHAELIASNISLAFGSIVLVARWGSDPVFGAGLRDDGTHLL